MTGVCARGPGLRDGLEFSVLREGQEQQEVELEPVNAGATDPFLNTRISAWTSSSSVL